MLLNPLKTKFLVNTSWVIILLIAYRSCEAKPETINFNIGSFDNNIAGANSLNSNGNAQSTAIGPSYGGGFGGFGNPLVAGAQVLAYDIGQDLRMLMGR